jgi:multiple antibiotic resistance protein
MAIIGVAFSIFLVFNVIGNIPFFIAILKPYPEKRKNQILLRELIIALFILLSFAYFGDHIMHFLGITTGIIGVAGGILLFLIALTMIFPKQEIGGNPQHEPFIVPIAVPIMSGPGSITAVMVYSHQVPSMWHLTLAIFLAWLPSLIIVMGASYIKYLVGEKGLVAFERFGGLLISLIAVQMISSGTIQLVKDNFNITEKPVALISEIS